MKASRLNGFKSGRKIRKDIFFNKKKRKELRKTFLIGQKAILQNSDFSVKPFSEEEYAERRLDAPALAFTVTGLETVKKAEDSDKKTYLTNCKYGLYKKGKSAVFKGTFLKPLIDNKAKTSFLYFPQGLPKNTKKKGFIYKDKKRLELKGYKLEDSGTFKQKIIDFYKLSLDYKGKKTSFKFKLKLVNEEKQSYWVTIL